MIGIQEATTEADFRQIEALADAIWREHYIPIIGKPQVDYMLEKYQTAPAIAGQVEAGMRYLLLLWKGRPAGYFAYEKSGTDLFLSKIYVDKKHRGRGLGRAAMDNVREAARAARCNRITLTVNKNNADSIAAYLRMGFRQGPGKIQNIGDGFIMDDYLMILDL